MNPFQLSHAENDAQYQACFAVMRELRPHLADAASFSAQVQRQIGQGYRLLVAWQDGQAKALAGYRLQENLLFGRFLYVDDLVASTESRRHGLGARLIDALRELGREQGCAHLVLDTALANALGQRFYYRQGLLAKALNFSQPL
ncbi:GNAT family N-acetyltransferase [Pseudomonas sp. NPDC089554]|uniref:GNAT family N-acetyltransferase n=1 Tax=Pseudomonas sp. NPDC089554 TaxID=3390653 RepID=UPI003D064C0B